MELRPDYQLNVVEASLAPSAQHSWRWRQRMSGYRVTHQPLRQKVLRSGRAHKDPAINLSMSKYDVKVGAIRMTRMPPSWSCGANWEKLERLKDQAELILINQRVHCNGQRFPDPGNRPVCCWNWMTENQHLASPTCSKELGKRLDGEYITQIQGLTTKKLQLPISTRGIWTIHRAEICSST